MSAEDPTFFERERERLAAEITSVSLGGALPSSIDPAQRTLDVGL